jgi:hypothetical protein
MILYYSNKSAYDCYKNAQSSCFEIKQSKPDFTCVNSSYKLMLEPELSIRYFFPYSLFTLPLLQHLFSLSLLRYFSKKWNTLLAIRYHYFCFISVADCINFRAISSVKDLQH